LSLTTYVMNAVPSRGLECTRCSAVIFLMARLSLLMSNRQFIETIAELKSLALRPSFLQRAITTRRARLLRISEWTWLPFVLGKASRSILGLRPFDDKAAIPAIRPVPRRCPPVPDRRDYIEA